MFRFILEYSSLRDFLYRPLDNRSIFIEPMANFERYDILACVET